MADEQELLEEEEQEEAQRDLIDQLIDDLNDGVDYVTFDRDVLEITGLRLIVLPLMMALLMRLMGIESTALHICTILLAMPVASNTASIAERYGGDYVFASACVSVSTLLSVITVPFITWIMTML